MEAGYVLYGALLFIPGLAVLEVLTPSWKGSLTSKLAAAFGLSMGVNVSVVVLCQFAKIFLGIQPFLSTNIGEGDSRLRS